ncbi:hypothetical protein ANN_03298 [Periplaneta americana]|uniref:Uncharacterized protein n=1 Tax=Periplaneta americana TaxID=6978 RepID=A0ABQ8TYL0_PERAM|nr:hypothetical protein ANN_03298 [Periplaneta americana]
MASSWVHDRPRTGKTIEEEVYVNELSNTDLARRMDVCAALLTTFDTIPKRSKSFCLHLSCFDWNLAQFIYSATNIKGLLTPTRNIRSRGGDEYFSNTAATKFARSPTPSRNIRSGGEDENIEYAAAYHVEPPIIKRGGPQAKFGDSSSRSKRRKAQNVRKSAEIAKNLTFAAKINWYQKLVKKVVKWLLVFLASFYASRKHCAAAKKKTAQEANLNFNAAVSQAPGDIFAPVWAHSYTAMFSSGKKTGATLVADFRALFTPEHDRLTLCPQHGSEGMSVVADSIFNTKIARMHAAPTICFVIHTPSSGRSGNKSEARKETENEGTDMDNP